MTSRYEIVLTLFGMSALAAGQFYGGGNFYLFLFLIAGTAAGAVVGVWGGKRLSMFNIGAASDVANAACHFAVVVIFGPLVMEYAIKKNPEMSPESIAATTGGLLALFGTNLLIHLASILPEIINLIRWKIGPKPAAPPEPVPPPSPISNLNPPP